MRLSVFTLNCWLLPLNLSRHNKKRLDFICDFLEKKKPDIVALQEVFQKKNIIKIHKRLGKLYHIISFSGRMFNRNGLVILSKAKPIKVKFIPFPKNKDYPNDMIGWFSRRGILLAEFQNFLFYNTHLYIKPGEDNIELTLKELAFLKNNIGNDKQSIICGDMNLTSAQFNFANKGFFANAENEVNTFSFRNPYLKKWWDPKVKGDKKIDYILVRNPSKIKFKSKTIKEPAMSDHYGIYSEINITSKINSKLSTH